MEELLGLINGDEDVVRRIYKDNLFKIINFILKQGGSTVEAEDIFQNALEATITRYAKKPFQIETTFGAYIYKVCTYMWYKVQRDKKREDQVRNVRGVTHIDESPDLDDMQLELELILNRTMKMLSSLCQQLILMIKAEVPTDRILKDLEFNSPNTMYRRKHACMKSWRKFLTNDVQYLNWKRNHE